MSSKRIRLAGLGLTALILVALVLASSGQMILSALVDFQRPQYDTLGDGGVPSRFFLHGAGKNVTVGGYIVPLLYSTPGVREIEFNGTIVQVLLSEDLSFESEGELCDAMRICWEYRNDRFFQTASGCELLMLGDAPGMFGYWTDVCDVKYVMGVQP